MSKKELFAISKTALGNWLRHNQTLKAAALTFFIILPLPSLLLIVLAIFTQFFGQSQAFLNLIQQVSALAGPAVADLIRQLLESATTPFTSVFATVTSVGFSIVGAIGAFAVLRDTMDQIWGVSEPKPMGFRSRVRRWIGPFIEVTALGVILLTLTGTTTVLFGYLRLALEPLTGALSALILGAAQVVSSFVLAAILLALMYKEVPDARIGWSDVKAAAIITAVAFTITNSVFGIYLQTFTVTTVVGAAGALIVLLLWIFVINQIILFGAEFSKAYHTKKHASFHVQPQLLPQLQVRRVFPRAAARRLDVEKDQIQMQVHPQSEIQQKPEQQEQKQEPELEQEPKKSIMPVDVEVNLKLRYLHDDDKEQKD